MRFLLKILFYVLILIGLIACAANAPEEPQITIEEPWVRAAVAMQNAAGGQMEGGEESGAGGMQMGGATSAAYMLIRNAGRQPDRLIEAHSDAAEVVETHISETQDGVTTMSRVESIDVPAMGSVELKPGGLHIMLINLN